MNKRPQCITRIMAITAVLIMALAFVMPQSGISYADAEVTVPVKISFSGEGLPEETFTVQIKKKSTSKTFEAKATLHAGKTAEEISISLGSLSEGLHTYELKEVPGTKADITYDSKVYTYYVLVNGDGTVEQRVVNADDPDDKPAMVEFANSYRKGDPGGPGDLDDPDAVIGDPPVRVKKKISLTRPEKVDRFIFIMRPENPGYPLPDVKAAGSGVIRDGVAEVYLNGEGEVEIGNITFTEEGTYRYFVSEKDTALDGYDYDDARFTVTYEVTRDQDGKLTCRRTITKKGGGEVYDCEFDNIHHPSKVIRKLDRAVKTGDPSIMWPITAMIAALIMMIAITVDRRNRRRFAADEGKKQPWENIGE